MPADRPRPATDPLASLRDELADLRARGLHRTLHALESSQDAEVSLDGRRVLNFCSNNYLGLANDPRVITEAQKVLSERGFGLSSVRFICGTTDYHKKLEKDISEFYEQEDTILFPSCFDANEAVFEALLGEQDAIVSDKLNHASIINGIRLCKAKRFLYENNDMKDLEAKLEEAKSARFKIIVTDGVFSMDGYVAHINKMCELAEKYEALVMVDECHGTGVLGKLGRGATEVEGALKKIDFISSTLGKALGGATGGFITGRAEIIEWLRQKARTYLFSNSLPTHSVAAANVALNILKSEPERLQTLAKNIALFKTSMKALGFEIIGHDESAICPVMIRNEQLAVKMAEDLLDEGIYVIAFSYPVVGKGLARIRVQLSAGHTEKDVKDCIAAFEKTGKKNGLIK